jgi:anti-anti-sigma factor
MRGIPATIAALTRAGPWWLDEDRVDSEILRIDVVRGDDMTNVILEGEGEGDVDFSSRDSLAHALVSAIESSRTVVVDLGLVTYIDSTGIRALLAAREAIAGSGTVTIKRPTKRVRTLLEVAGVLEWLCDGGDSDDAA